MDTKILSFDTKQPDIEGIREAAAYLRAGKLVVFPTETVYGIGANALSAEAAHKIYAAKGRPSDNPLIVHLATVEELPHYVSEISDKAKRLAEAFWPGPLTMIFQKKDNIPDEITGGLGSVGIRIPAHPIAGRILQEAKVPVAAPSANLSGKPSPTLFSHVREDLWGKVDMMIDADGAEVGLESTVVDMTTEIPIILRPGGITREQLEAVIGEVKINRGTMSQSEIPMAPGMKYRHYAPKGKLQLLERSGFEQEMQELKRCFATAEARGVKAAAMLPHQHARQMNRLCYDLGEESDLEEIARHIFAALRFMDEREVEEIYALSFPEEGIGEAIMNRLRKAAGKF